MIYKNSTHATNANYGKHRRLFTIDLLRGIVMILMVIDHTRLFLYCYHPFFDPLDLDTTNFALFMTRWITHLCAPVFIFLAGISALLISIRSKSKVEFSRFVLFRGLWIVFLEFTIIHCIGWSFTLDMHNLTAGVFWAIGCSMIVLSLLVYLPIYVICIFGLILIFGHNALDWVNPEHLGAYSEIWKILHEGGRIVLLNGSVNPYIFNIAYPLIPWIGLMAVGYCFGFLISYATKKHFIYMLSLGLMLVFLFIVLRGINYYGDPSKWSQQKDNLFTILSFIN